MQTQDKPNTINARLFDEEEKRPLPFPFTGATHRVVPFRPEWLDEQGLPTRLGDWVIENLPPGETFVGVRVVEDEHFAFQITRAARTPAGLETSRAFVARFDMSSHRVMEVVPGSITISDSRSDRQLKKFLEYRLEDGGTYWKLYSEIRKVVVETYDECPNILLYALQQIDTMAYRITQDSTGGSRLSTLLGMLGSGSPFEDRYGNKSTPYNIRMVYYMVRDKMRQQQAEAPAKAALKKNYTVTLVASDDNKMTPDVIRLIYLERIESASGWNAFKDAVRRVALGQLTYSTAT